jgi:hypothetical protein
VTKRRPEDDDAPRDERYRFQGFPPDFLVGLARLTLGATYLEGVVATMLWRLLDNYDLEVGKRTTAEANFRWLCDHVRAISEHRLPAELHVQVAAWVSEAQSAYGARSRIVHSGLAVNVTEEGIGHVWVRTSARGKRFAEEITAADAADVHAVAIELERVGLVGVELMGPVQDVVGRPEPGASSPHR